jgi:hypothetical protein
MPGEQMVSVQSDPDEPDWRFTLVRGDEVLGEGYFDCDHGWSDADEPRGWTVRFVPAGPWEDHGLEVPLEPGGRRLLWSARDAAAAEAVRLLQRRMASERVAA